MVGKWLQIVDTRGIPPEEVNKLNNVDDMIGEFRDTLQEMILSSSQLETRDQKMDFIFMFYNFYSVVLRFKRIFPLTYLKIGNDGFCSSLEIGGDQLTQLTVMIDNCKYSVQNFFTALIAINDNDGRAQIDEIFTLTGHILDIFSNYNELHNSTCKKYNAAHNAYRQARDHATFTALGRCIEDIHEMLMKQPVPAGDNELKRTLFELIGHIKRSMLFAEKHLFNVN